MHYDQLETAGETSASEPEQTAQFEGTDWVGDRRLEAAARAMARHRLECHSFSPRLTAELIQGLRQIAEERLWPTLIDEARAALDAADQVVTALPLAAPFAGAGATSDLRLPDAGFLASGNGAIPR
jgi:hypothetical protein